MLQVPGLWRLYRLTPSLHSPQINSTHTGQSHCLSLPPPTSCIPPSLPGVWDIFTFRCGEMEGCWKWKEKTISSTDGPVWGNEIAYLIVACNGEQFEVNWGEIGHWATVCRSIVVGRRVYQWGNHWTQKKKKKKKISYQTSQMSLIFPNGQKMARSIVIVIKFIFSSLSGSGLSE